MPVRPAPLVRLAAPLAAALLLAGCSGGGSTATADLVKADALPAGSCRQAAAPLNEVHRQVAGLRSASGSSGSAAAAARQPLAGATRDLQAAATAGTAGGTAGGTVPARLTDLMQAVGFLRLGIDTHSYDAALLTRTDDAAAQLVKACGAG